MTRYCGIDGCSAGWLAISTQGNSYKYGVFSTIDELHAKHLETQVCLIDVPIGLASRAKPRTIDAKMRKELTGRASTVFTTPCRKSVYAGSYDEAKSINKAVEGKSLSKQAFCITPKIREVDEFLLKNPNLKLIEAHPEISFKYLNDGGVLRSRKSKPEGIEERLSILERYNRKTPDLYQGILGNTLRKHVRRDDILDAICLAISMELGAQKLQYLKDENAVDERGIEMKIGYFDPSTT